MRWGAGDCEGQWGTAWGTVSQLEHRAGEVARTDPHRAQGTGRPLPRDPGHLCSCEVAFARSHLLQEHVGFSQSFLKSLAMYGVPFSVGRDHCPVKAPFKGVLTGNWTLNLGRRFLDLTLYFCGSRPDNLLTSQRPKSPGPPTRPTEGSHGLANRVPE